MIRHVLSYLLITLLALQSVVAAADVHQPHETGDEHAAIEQTHDHHHDTIVADSNNIATDDGTESELFDCNHCCHCHGAGQVFLRTVQNTIAIGRHDSIAANYLFTYISYRASPDTPPPIS